MWLAKAWRNTCGEMRAGGIPASAGTAAARIAASPRHAEWVAIKVNATDSVMAWVVYPTSPNARAKAPVVVAEAEMSVVASAGMFFLQAVAQRHVSAEKAAVIYAMEPVFAAVFAWLWLNEVLTTQASVGAALVVLAVVMSEYPSRQRA